MTPSEWVTLLIDKAPALRAAGVQRMTMDGVSVELAPHRDPEPKGNDDEQIPMDPLEDPLTYGRRHGVPGYAFERDDKRSE